MPAIEPDRFLLPAWEGGDTVIMLDLPDLARSPIRFCRNCGFQAPVNHAGRCGACENEYVEIKEGTTGRADR